MSVLWALGKVFIKPQYTQGELSITMGQGVGGGLSRVTPFHTSLPAQLELVGRRN